MGNMPAANQFWAKVEQGALDKGKELGVDVTVLGSPGGEGDVAGQIALVEDQLTKGITGLAIAPADPAALAPTIEKALDQGVKVVYIDRPGRARRHHLCRHRQRAGGRARRPVHLRQYREGQRCRDPSGHHGDRQRPGARRRQPRRALEAAA